MGRPFVVRGHERTARAALVRDWCGLELEPALGGLGAVTRHLLAGYWTDVGRSKHAGVAAYGRLAMQLLGLGAPPELVAGAHVAMGEELRQARYAFSLASAFRLLPVGPAPLVVEDALDDADTLALLLDVIQNGCVAMTVASNEARALVESVEDPAVRFVVSEIAESAAEQGLFAWRTLQWLCDELGDPARDVVGAECARLGAELDEIRSELPPSPLGDDTLLRAGYPSARMRRELRTAALERALFNLRALAARGCADDDADRVTVS